MNDTPTKTCSKCGNEYPATTEYFSKKKGCKFGVNSICKPCGAAYTRQWVAANPEKKRASDKHYAETHREKVREYSRRSYWKNPVKSRQEQRDWNASHREQRRATSRKWNVKNTKHMTFIMREWRHNNPEMARAAKARRRTLEMNAEGSHAAADLTLQFESQKGMCWWCSEPLPPNFHVDHRVPLSRGGSNNPENLCLACPQCNQSKNDKLPSEWIGRLL